MYAFAVRPSVSNARVAFLTHTDHIIRSACLVDIVSNYSDVVHLTSIWEAEPLMLESSRRLQF